ncbi:site-specific integrase [Rhodococcus pyridinivorans]|uniref:site-specific integrase n=1 Tax=Rhodococcus pyridinivorans TaxID=103816 RepID=UPI002000091C|nr:tyrosine-type recombinase/integrase [Rhodococcus pyridinivorans]UPK64654.1 site-specific integrase [Rhodococcus pyridinivorans]
MSRRQPGDGGVTEYTTSNGPRWSIRYYVPNPDGGTPRRVQKRGYTTKKAAKDALRGILQDISKGTYQPPTKHTVATWLDHWIETKRLRPGTLASYRRTIDNHVKPHVGAVKLQDLTPTRLDRLYRHLETKGSRRGHQAGETGLSPRTVRYTHTILSSALKAAIHDGLLNTNPADRAHPPTATEAKPEEMTAWTPEQARVFLTWTREHRDLWECWHVLIHTGLRRGELVGIRWADVDLDRATLSIKRSIGIVLTAGKRTPVIGPTKTGKARVIDLDASTVEVLRAWRKARGAVGMQLVRQDAYVFGDLAGGHSDPDTLSDRFRRHLESVQAALGEEAVPTIRVHDLRHTHASGLLRAGIPAKVVSERLGHSDVTTTLRVYAHTLPGMQAEAAKVFASMMA